MNVPYPKELTQWENASGMCIPTAEPQSPVTTGAVKSDADAADTREQTTLPIVEASQYLNYVDHVPATTTPAMEDHRATEETQKTQDPSTPIEAETPDEISINRKVSFHMVPCALVSLLMRVMGIKGASAETRVEG